MIVYGKPNFGHEEIVSGGVRSWASGPDSAGGVGVQISIKNDSEKTIKYVRFKVIPYNAVNDVVSSSIGGVTDKWLKITGPIHPGARYNRAQWESLWYNYSIARVEILEIHIEYMDGSMETIPAKDIHYEQNPGCYVATAVYHSYDCPQVWTLRRFRDGVLAEHWYGRAFVRLYYAVSPTLVRWFGESAWFQRLWRGPLDRLVAQLQARGVEDTPYQDKIW